MILRWFTIFALATAATTGAALAHVRVFPDANVTQASACSYTTFVVRVPVEKDVPTNRIDLAIPHGIIVYGVQPKVGWQFSEQKVRGVISEISWSGGRLMPGEFDEFAFLAATPKTPGQIAWDALQYYEDGSVVKWTGPPGADTPHSITTIVPSTCPVRKKVR